MLAKISFLLLCTVLICVSAFKANDTDLETIVQKLGDWTQKHPQEKAYLHLNKSLFLNGDTIYCKAYVLNAGVNTPSSISRTLYIDLTDDKSAVKKTLVLPLSDGIGWCAIPVNSQLKSGNYHIRAYTNWMRNSDGFFFDKPVTILDGSDKKLTSSKTQSNHRIYFFPEGGQMVAGLPVCIAFKAVGANSLGISASGVILDESGKKIINFQSSFAGMGSFVFTPLPQHIYSATLKYSDGYEDKAVLPNAEKSGYALTIDNLAKENISINVMAKGAPDDVKLIAQSGNRVQYSSKITLQNGTVSMKVSKKKFPTGIAQFTLFANNDLPVAERLIFINHNDQLHIDALLDKAVSGKRGKMKLVLHVTDNLDEPVTGSFSVAVTDAATTPYNKSKEENILTNLLLTSDLKGYVENPAYYFVDEDSSRLKDLDNLLLTQGWRRFQWKDVLTEQPSILRYAAEKNLSLTGRVMLRKEQPAPDATVSLLSKIGNGLLLQTKTDSDGNFKFEDLAATDDSQFALQAVTKDGSKNAVITINNFSTPATSDNQISNSTFTSDSIASYISANTKLWEEKMKYGLISDDVHTLKNVTVTTTKLTKIQQAVAPSYNLNGPGNADQVLTYDDLFNCYELSKCLSGKITGVVIKRVIDPVSRTAQTVAYSAQSGSAMTIIIDGVISDKNLDYIPANNIQAIEVLRTGGYLAVYGASGGVLVITTKKGNLDYNHLDSNKSADKNLLFTTVHGYTVRREFYSPDYSVASNNTTIPDLRSTIYWQPNIVTDEDGNATIEWYNADVTGKYNIVIEGISNDGRIGSSSLSYTVK